LFPDIELQPKTRRNLLNAVIRKNQINQTPLLEKWDHELGSPKTAGKNFQQQSRLVIICSLVKGMAFRGFQKGILPKCLPITIVKKTTARSLENIVGNNSCNSACNKKTLRALPCKKSQILRNLQTIDVIRNGHNKVYHSSGYCEFFQTFRLSERPPLVNGNMWKDLE